MSIVTDRQVVHYIGAEDEDEMVALIRAAVEERVVAYAERPFEATARTWYLDGSNLDKIWLPEPLASTPSEVNVDTGRTWASATAKTHGTDYVWRSEEPSTLLALATVWTHYPYCIKVTGTVGYTADSMPSDIKLVCLKECALAYSQMKRSQKGDDVVRSQNVEHWDVTYLEDMELSTAAKQVLKRYAANPDSVYIYH